MGSASRWRRRAGTDVFTEGSSGDRHVADVDEDEHEHACDNSPWPGPPGHSTCVDD